MKTEQSSYQFWHTQQACRY